VLESVAKQVCALSTTLPADTTANITQTFLPLLLEEMALRQQPPIPTTTHVGTQTLESGKMCEKPLIPVKNWHDLSQYIEENDTDQSVPSIIRQIPASAESKKGGQGDKMAELPLDKPFWNQENQQQNQMLKQKQNKQQQELVPLKCSGKNSSYSNTATELDFSSSKKSCVEFSMDPSPVYDLDLTQLPVVIEKETCDSVCIERKVVYGKLICVCCII